MFSEEVLVKARRVLDLANAAGVMVATAESCTGGMVVCALTDTAGCSSVVDRGFVTYSNEAKMEMIGVPEETLASFGAVSEETARAMAKGAVEHSKARVAVSITGIAGPGGGSEQKPVGLVHFAAVTLGGEVLHVERRFGDLGRAKVREEALKQALDLLAEALQA